MESLCTKLAIKDFSSLRNVWFLHEKETSVFKKNLFSSMHLEEVLRFEIFISLLITMSCIYMLKSRRMIFDYHITAYSNIWWIDSRLDVMLILHFQMFSISQHFQHIIEKLEIFASYVAIQEHFGNCKNIIIMCVLNCCLASLTIFTVRKKEHA